jgi:MFS family permease
MSTWGALVVLCLTMFIVVLDASMMNVAVPQITKDLHTSVGAVQTVIALHSLVMASLMLAGAKLGKIRGAKKVFCMSLWVYGAGTLIATFSPNIEILALGWSLVEGIAAAALVPLAMSLIIVNYSGAKRGLAFGVLGGFQATAAAIGPIFGGFLTTRLTWRAGFAFEVVIVILVLSLLKYVEGAPADRTQTFDWVGTGLSVAGLGSVVIAALLAGRHGWWVARRPLRIAGLELAPMGLSVTPWLLFVGVVILGLFGSSPSPSPGRVGRPSSILRSSRSASSSPGSEPTPSSPSPWRVCCSSPRCSSSRRSASTPSAPASCSSPCRPRCSWCRF